MWVRRSFAVFYTLLPSQELRETLTTITLALERLPECLMQDVLHEPFYSGTVNTSVPSIRVQFNVEFGQLNFISCFLSQSQFLVDLSRSKQTGN